MENFNNKEQIMLAYYVQYYRGASTEEVKALDDRLRNEVGEELYDKTMRELEEEGYVSGVEAVEKSEEEGAPIPMATNEGILYINSALSFDPYAVEESLLNYLDNYLETSGLEFTLEPVKAYVEEAIRQEEKDEPNENRP